jgi:hypothetical protein
MSKSRGRLAVGTELRPQVDHWCLVSDNAGPDEQVSDQRRHDLAGREAEDRGLGGHPPPGHAVGDAGDGIDNKSTVVVNGNLQAGFGSGIHEFVEDALDLLLK